jgi:hypothetical protein
VKKWKCRIEQGEIRDDSTEGGHLDLLANFNNGNFLKLMPSEMVRIEWIRLPTSHFEINKEYCYDNERARTKEFDYS